MHLRRDSDDDCAGGDILDDQRVGADLAVVANRDVANDLGSGTDEDTVANRGVTLEPVSYTHLTLPTILRV